MLKNCWSRPCVTDDKTEKRADGRTFGRSILRSTVKTECYSSATWRMNMTRANGQLFTFCAGCSGLALVASCVKECELQFTHFNLYKNKFHCSIKCVFYRVVNVKTNLLFLEIVYGHTTLKAPVLVRSPKLSNVGPG